MDNCSWFFVMFSGLIFSGTILGEYAAGTTIPIDLVSVISVADTDWSDYTISTTDVKDNNPLFTELLRREWCTTVNDQLDRKVGRNRFLERIPPGRVWTYEIGGVGGIPTYVHGFVCAGDPKCFLVAVHGFTRAIADIKLHGYTLQKNSTIVTNLGETNAHHAGVYTLRAI